MGVLKVYDGTDWRTVGCGGTAGFPGYAAGSTSSGSGTTISITLPSGIQAGDLLIIAVGTNARFGIGGPTGWTSLGGSPSGFGADVGIYSKIADGTESSATVSWTSSFSRVYVTQCRVYRGPTSVSDVGGTASGSAGTSYAAPEMTYSPGGDFDYVYFFVAHDPTNTAPPAVTPPTGTEDGLSNSNSRVTMASGSTPETGSSGSAGDHTASSDISSDWAVVRFGVERAEQTVGRLKLWDGTQWVREACDGDTGGHPLKLWDGTSWVTVACMVPA